MTDFQGGPDPTRRLDRWRQRRAAHLAGLQWLGTETTGGQPVRYVSGELLVVDEHYDDARRVVEGLGHRAADVATDEPLPGVRRLRAPGLDAVRATRRTRERASDGGVAGPNHVLLASPYEQGGPFGRPVAAAAAAIDGSPAADGAARVVVMDTGVWADSPLPASRYQVAQADYETDVDVDRDNVIDSDVGHANFIAGVVLQGTRQAQVRIVKVLDTFGVGTELQLALRIAALTDVDVLSLSLGAYTVDGEPPVLLRWALNRFLLGRDRVAVAAAGNDGVTDRPFWPAGFAGADVPWRQQVLAVAAHDGQALCPWSNSGPWVTLAAPGADVVSTYIHHPEFGTGWAAWSGTSFATPHVVALIAEHAASTGSVLSAAKQVMSSSPRSIGGYAAVL
ncbi:S8/S53 family peptidase [Dactylosporangium sp. NBC_01737]|uniref:S8 family peptidase n=1 Tax=Dactylosporangium sp. NBC_01737 TaxID=2975959 RepID=UPI002E1327AE|nr:S8/S53 family peptidase [Dactylosporangium sp. NBC_01737]